MSLAKEVSQMLNEQGMAAFENAIRLILETRRAELNMTEQSLGLLAFPHLADSRRKIQSIRKGQGAKDKRKPQQLRGTDILNLCEALGLSWKKVFADALDAAKQAQESARLDSLKKL